MQFVKKWIALVTIVSMCAFALTVLSPQPVRATQGPQQVQIINSQLPVAVQGAATVTGSVAIAGTPSVNVSGFASGASVAISNPAANPVLVRNVDRGLNPLQAAEVALAADGAPCGTKNVLTVPAGKRFVIEHVSLFLALPSGQKPYLAGLSGGPIAGDSFVPQMTGGDGISDLFAANHQTRLYVDEGLVIAFGYCRYPTSGAGSGQINIAGYLMDMP